MNLFWKKLFGGITSTEKFEKQEQDFQQTVKSYFEIEQSNELKEYKELHETVNSKDFQNKKQLYTKRKYKECDEYKTLKDFEKLQKKKGAEDSIEYQRLKEKVSTPEFKQANDFWQNSSRWNQCEECKIENRYLELQKHPAIASYLKQDPKEMEKYQGREITFFDSFNEKGTNNPKWKAGFYYEKPLIGHFSYANELQANNEGKNVAYSNGTLKLATKYGKVTTSPAWDKIKGFIEKEFYYTADVVQTGETFSQKYGVFQAKVRGNGVPHHALWLGSNKQLPYIQMVQIHGKKIIVGTIDAKGNKTSSTVTGLKPSEYYIYTLIWNNKELIWKINNLEVFRTSNNIPANEMYLGVNSYLPQTEKAGEGMVEIDWMRVYNK